MDGVPHVITVLVHDYDNRPDAAAAAARSLINQDGDFEEVRQALLVWSAPTRPSSEEPAVTARDRSAVV